MNIFRRKRGRRTRAASYRPKTSRLAGDRRKRVPMLAHVQSWIFHNRLLALILAAVVLVGIIAGVFLLCLPGQSAQIAAQPVKTQGEEDAYASQIADGEIDAETLAGLRGENASAQEDGDQMEERAVIGVIAGSSDSAQAIVDGFGVYAEELVTTGAGLDDYLIYTTEGDANQQIQDVRSMINQHCDAIVTVDVDYATAQIIYQLASKAGIPVISVGTEDEGNCDVRVTLADIQSPLNEYASFISTQVSAGTVTYISEEPVSDAALASLQAALSRSTLAAAALAKNSEDYKQSLAALFNETSPSPAVIVQAGLAREILNAAAKQGGIPGVFASDATAGLVKLWHQLKHGGISVELPLAEDAPEGAEPQTKQVIAPGAKLISVVSAGNQTLGRAACRFAYLFACGRTLCAQSETVFEVSGAEQITDENLAQYYALYQNSDNSLRIQSGIDERAIDALFTEAKQ